MSFNNFLLSLRLSLTSLTPLAHFSAIKVNFTFAENDSKTTRLSDDVTINNHEMDFSSPSEKKAKTTPNIFLPGNFIFRQFSAIENNFLVCRFIRIATHFFAFGNDEMSRRFVDFQFEIRCAASTHFIFSELCDGKTTKAFAKQWLWNKKWHCQEKIVYCSADDVSIGQ